jgi:hypothetical protein
MKSRLFAQNLALRSGLTLSIIGLLSVAMLLIYNHGLEDTLPFILYLIAFTTIPLGLILCIAGVAVSCCGNGGSNETSAHFRHYRRFQVPLS